MNRKSGTLKTLSLILPLLLIIVVPAISNSAEKVRVKEGLIENVTFDSIEVNGEYYYISGVPLKDASGEDLSKDELKTGRKVAIFLRGKSIKSVLIYDENMLE